MFNNEAKRQEKYAKDSMNFEQKQSIVSSQLPEHGEDEQIQMESQKERADLIRWQQDLSDEAIRFIMEVRGYYENADGDWVKDPRVKPLANEEFIRRIRPLLLPSVSRNQMMTSYSEERVLRALKRAASQFATILYLHGEKLGVNIKDFSMLVASFQATIEPTYFRALNNGERRYLTTINKRVETFSDGSEPKKKTLFGIGA